MTAKPTINGFRLGGGLVLNDKLISSFRTARTFYGEAAPVQGLSGTVSASSEPIFSG